MKDPTYSATRVDALALRIHFQQETHQSSSVASNASSEIDTQVAEASEMPLCKVTRSSEESLKALSSLPATAMIVLFTPVLIPASRSRVRHEADAMDPFEPLGRAFSQWYKRIRHVPYVPKIGFRAAHEAFVSQADVIIIVVCEPAGPVGNSFAHQMDFAEQAMHVMEEKEANASNTLVLIQSGSEQFRSEVDAAFVNVVEVPEYNAEVAKDLAKTIFKSKR